MRLLHTTILAATAASQESISWQEQLINRLSQHTISNSWSLHSSSLEEDDSCADRCILNPSNRLSCGRSRSRDQCDSLNCCWDADSEMCYKQVFDHCPKDTCERIDPQDRQMCSEILGPDLNQEECAELGCCYDSYVDFCYSSVPKETAMAPATLECESVESSQKESCGYGLSRDACLERTGCCWHVDENASTYCYKLRIYNHN
ncbi:Oidioi.mRNA.OKI2018_I69.XSR.g14084.t1.cds [Oikopleura dioica]|uniref:Oidioi.mRNA.OKI2018_I69.XSR.g14084.t1.cds n=1 Tax=Oikopleura dioica TaxID=34765 RepID=A0ABN7SF14_OIKDI|nr:Oidioi.mRNA.OKI2018_I69.XSR.g14084.t1.cds [Oikopleura dioica]